MDEAFAAYFAHERTEVDFAEPMRTIYHRLLDKMHTIITSGGDVWTVAESLAQALAGTAEEGWVDEAAKQLRLIYPVPEGDRNVYFDGVSSTSRRWLGCAPVMCAAA